MACRCSDLEKFRADKDILEEIMDKINDLQENNSDIEDDLSTIAGVIPDTLIIPDETFCYDLTCVNNKCTEGISSMSYHVAVELEALEEEIQEAFLEDLAYHVSHPIETVKSWIDG